MLKLSSITVRNFMSVGEVPLVFKYSEGLHYVYGENHDVHDEQEERIISNGSGKTVVLVDALLFALFGRTQRKLKQNEMINVQTQSNCEVTVSFTKDDKFYEITRTLKPNSVTILIDGEPLNEEASRRNTDTFIVENVLNGISFEVFKNLIVLNANASKHFFEYGRQEKRQFINEVFHLGFLEFLQESLSNDMKDKKSNLDKAQLQLSNKESEIERMKKLTEEKKEANKVDNKERLRKSKEEEEKKRDEISKTMAKMEEFFQQPFDAFVERYEKANAVFNSTNLQINTLEREKDALSKQFKDLGDEYVQVKEQDTCHVCKQTLPKDNKEKVLEEIKNKAMLVKEKGVETSKNLDELKSKIPDMTKWLDKAKNCIQEYRNLSGQVDASNRLLSEIQRNLETTSEVINEERIFNEIKTMEEERKNLSSEVQLCERNFNLIKVSREIVNDKNFYGYYINIFRKFLNTSINEYLEKMASPHRISFNNDLDADVFDNNTNVHSYDNLSTGEKAKINIALLLSFFDVLNSYHRIETNVLILDEVLDQGIDSEGVELLHNILKSKVEERDDLGIYVVSHKNPYSELKNSEGVDRIVFQRMGGFTSLKEN